MLIRPLSLKKRVFRTRWHLVGPGEVFGARMDAACRTKTKQKIPPEWDFCFRYTD